MVDNTIALQVKPLDIATPLMQAAKMRQMESEQQRTQEADNRDAVASEMRGLAPYANSPDFAGRWTQSIDNLAQAGKMRPDIAARMRDQPSVMAMHSVLAQSERPEMQLQRDTLAETTRQHNVAQGNADRTFNEGVRQFNATPVTLGDNPVNGTVRGLRDPSSPTGFRVIDTNASGGGASPGQRPTPVSAPGEEASIPPNAQLVANESGRDIGYLKEVGQKYGPEVASTVKKIAAYEISPTSLSTKGGHREFYLGMASKFDPTYDATLFPKKQAAEIKFSTGPQGNAIRSFNTFVHHSATLEEALQAMNNGDIQAANRIWNAVKTQFGATGPVGAEAVAKVLGAEAVKAIVGAGGTGEERDAARKAFSAAGNSIPQVLEVIKQYKGLAGGQLVSLMKQYQEAGSYSDYQSREKFKAKLLPRTQKEMGKYLEPEPMAGDAASAPAAAGTVDYTSYFK